VADETPRDDEQGPPEDEQLPGDEEGADDEPEEEPPAGEHRILEDPDPDPDAPPPPATYAGRRAQEAPDRPQTDEFTLEGEITEGEVAAELEDEEQVEAEKTEKPDAGEPQKPSADDGEADESDDDGEADESDDDGEPLKDAESGETVEADTVGLADQEAAKEAAMRGLRSRTAEQAAKRRRSTGQVPVKTPAAATAAGAAAEKGEQGDAAEAGKAAEGATVAAAAADAEEEKESRRGLWPRFVAASLVVIVSMATATSVSILVYLTEIAKGLGGLPGIDDKLAAVEGGKPQNFLILGSDVRPTDTDRGRSDTTILMRIDADKNSISLFSLPRDLKANIPGHGVDRLNAAYTYGGPELTLETVKQLTGVDINHVVNVDFTGFADAVNAIDCVYVDVDRHYFHSNEGLAAEEQYAEIDIEAGYQRLCGFKALQYVRYRHEDNDLIRAARQQDFLREARQGVPPRKLLADRNELIDIFKKYTTSDIDKLADLVDLFKLLIDARGAEVKEVQFKGDIGGPTSSYVTASNDQIRDAVSEFLGEDSEPEPDPDDEKPKPEKDEPDKDKPKPDKDQQDDGEVPAADLVDSTGAGQAYADAVNSKDYDGPIYYPAKLNPGGQLTDDSRAIKIDGPEKEVYYGYKMVVAFQALGYTAYYGVSGTDWPDPPILENPSETRNIGGTEYMLFYDAGRLRMVGWKDGKYTFWVTNTLGQLLSEEQMLGIATGTKQVQG
jgi:LCP family protein required for cell wall assembly